MPAGPPYKFTPQQLQKKVDDYFQHLANNPMYKTDVVKTGEYAGKQLYIEVRPMPSLVGLCSHGGFYREDFYNWLKPETGEKNPELFNTATRAKYRIEAEQMAGAGSGLYQPMIVSRLNHLKDEQEVTQTNIEATGKSEEEIRAAIQAIQAARKK